MSTTEHTQELIRSKKTCYSVSGCRFDPSEGRLHAPLSQLLQVVYC